MPHKVKPPTVVPLTRRERSQRAEQLRLAKSEQSRLRLVKSQQERMRNSRTVVPLTIREVAQKKEQLRLALAEIARLKRITKELRAEVASKPKRTPRVKPKVTKKTSSRVRLEPWRQLDHVLKLAKKQLSSDKPVSNVHVNEKGWILGTDAHGRPMRAWVVLNSENKKLTTRWMYWDKRSSLPKKGFYVDNSDYESLKNPKYVMFGKFDSKNEQACNKCGHSIDEHSPSEHSSRCLVRGCKCRRFT